MANPNQIPDVMPSMTANTAGLLAARTGPASKPPLPDDMTGWLSTRECAEIFGMKERSFRDYAARNKFPKRSFGVPVYYAPELIATELKRRKAKQSADAKKSIQKHSAVKVALPVAPTPATEREFHAQALDALVLIVQSQARRRR